MYPCPRTRLRCSPRNTHPHSKRRAATTNRSVFSCLFIIVEPRQSTPALRCADIAMPRPSFAISHFLPPSVPVERRPPLPCHTLLMGLAIAAPFAGSVMPSGPVVPRSVMLCERAADFSPAADRPPCFSAPSRSRLRIDNPNPRTYNLSQNSVAPASCR